MSTSPNPSSNSRASFVVSLWAVLGLQGVSQHYRVMLAFSALLLVPSFILVETARVPYYSFFGVMVIVVFLYNLARRDVRMEFSVRQKSDKSGRNGARTE